MRRAISFKRRLCPVQIALVRFRIAEFVEEPCVAGLEWDHAAVATTMAGSRAADVERAAVDGYDAVSR